MKKKIILILVFCFLSFLLTEFLTYSIFKYRQIQEVKKTDFNLPDNYKYRFGYNYAADFFNNSFMREPVNFGNNHKILLFGCSYAYGAQLEPEQTFYYKLAQKTGSTIFNRSFPGWSNAYMLYQINNNGIGLNLNDIDKDIDTIIYIYMDDHKNRINKFYWGGLFSNIYNLQYKKVEKENGKKLVEYRPLFPYIHIFYISKFIHNSIENYLNSDKNTGKNIELLIDIFSESHKKLAEKYPKAKFIIISFKTDELDKYREEIQNAGWILYSTFDILDNQIDLNDEQYHFKNDPHPKEEAWNVIVDKFIEKKLI